MKHEKCNECGAVTDPDDTRSHYWDCPTRTANTMDSIEKAKINEEVLKQFEDIWQGAWQQGYLQGKQEGLQEGVKAVERIFNTKDSGK